MTARLMGGAGIALALVLAAAPAWRRSPPLPMPGNARPA